VEVAAYGMGHIMDPLEKIDPKQMRAVFPEAPTGGIEAASGGVDLLMGHDNLRLFRWSRGEWRTQRCIEAALAQGG